MSDGDFQPILSVIKGHLTLVAGRMSELSKRQREETSHWRHDMEMQNNCDELWELVKFIEMHRKRCKISLEHWPAVNLSPQHHQIQAEVNHDDQIHASISEPRHWTRPDQVGPSNQMPQIHQPNLPIPAPQPDSNIQVPSETNQQVTGVISDELAELPGQGSPATHAAQFGNAPAPGGSNPEMEEPAGMTSAANEAFNLDWKPYDETESGEQNEQLGEPVRHGQAGGGPAYLPNGQLPGQADKASQGGWQWSAQVEHQMPQTYLQNDPEVMCDVPVQRPDQGSPATRAAQVGNAPAPGGSNPEMEEPAGVTSAANEASNLDNWRQLLLQAESGEQNDQLGEPVRIHHGQAGDGPAYLPNSQLPGQADEASQGGQQWSSQVERQMPQMNQVPQIDHQNLSIPAPKLESHIQVIGQASWTQHNDLEVMCDVPVQQPGQGSPATRAAQFGNAPAPGGSDSQFDPHLKEFLSKRRSILWIAEKYVLWCKPTQRGLQRRATIETREFLRLLPDFLNLLHLPPDEHPDVFQGTAINSKQDLKRELLSNTEMHQGVPQDAPKHAVLFMRIEEAWLFGEKKRLEKTEFTFVSSPAGRSRQPFSVHLIHRHNKSSNPKGHLMLFKAGPQQTSGIMLFASEVAPKGSPGVPGQANRNSPGGGEGGGDDQHSKREGDSDNHHPGGYFQGVNTGAGGSNQSGASFGISDSFPGVLYSSTPAGHLASASAEQREGSDRLGGQKGPGSDKVRDHSRAAGSSERVELGEGASTELPEDVIFRKVFIEGIPEDADQEAIASRFGGFGQLEQVKVFERGPRSATGYGFVIFASVESAERALGFPNLEIGGASIKRRFAFQEDHNASSNASETSEEGRARVKEQARLFLRACDTLRENQMANNMLELRLGQLPAFRAEKELLPSPAAATPDVVRNIIQREVEGLHSAEETGGVVFHVLVEDSCLSEWQATDGLSLEWDSDEAMRWSCKQYVYSGFAAAELVEVRAFAFRKERDSAQPSQALLLIMAQKQEARDPTAFTPPRPPASAYVRLSSDPGGGDGLQGRLAGSSSVLPTQSSINKEYPADGQIAMGTLSLAPDGDLEGSAEIPLASDSLDSWPGGQSTTAHTASEPPHSQEGPEVQLQEDEPELLQDSFHAEESGPHLEGKAVAELQLRSSSAASARQGAAPPQNSQPGDSATLQLPGAAVAGEEPAPPSVSLQAHCSPQPSSAPPRKEHRTLDNESIQQLLQAGDDFSAALEVCHTLKVHGRPDLTQLVADALKSTPNALSIVEVSFQRCRLSSQQARTLVERQPPGLQNLDLSGNQIGAEGARALADHLPPGLQSLDLSQNRIGDEGVRALADRLPPGLQSLDLSGNQIGAEGARALEDRLPPGVQSLDLRQNEIDDEGARALAELLPPGLQSLHLSRNWIGDEGALALAKRLPPGLQSLDLSQNRIGDEGARALGYRLPLGLQSLDLHRNEIGDEGLRALAERLPPGLQSLDLSQNRIGDVGARALADRLPPGLQSLNLLWNEIGDEGVRALTEPLPPGLQSLDLSLNRIGDEEARALAERLPPGLQSLDLNSNEIGAEGARALAEWLPFGLQSLDLSLNRISYEGVRALAKWLPPGLQRLHLKSNGIGAQGACALAEWLPPFLHSLDLCQNWIGAEGARALAERLPPSLQSLDLSFNRIGDEEAQALAEGLPPGLQSLDLSWNEIGYEGVRALAERLPPGLQGLHLNNNGIGAEGARALAERLPPGLQSLDLRWNKIGDEGVRALAERLPPGLQSLNLSLNRIGYEGVRALAEGLPRGLQSLDLNSNKFGAEGARALSERLPPGLQSLDLNSNEIGAEGSRALAERLPPGLQSLDLKRNDIGAEGASALAERLPPGLQSLDLSLNRIGYEGVRALAEGLPLGLKSLHLKSIGIGARRSRLLAERLPPGLQILDLSWNGIFDEGLRALAERLPPGLQRLHLNGLDIGTEGVQALAERLPPGLQSLDLSRNGIGDEGARALAERLPPGLQRLHLKRLEIGAEGVPVLAERLPPGLQSLDLSSNEIGAEGARALADRLPRGLQSLDLSLNRIGDEEARELAELLPPGLQRLHLQSLEIGAKGVPALAERLPPGLHSLDLRWNRIGGQGALALAERLPPGLQSLDLHGKQIGAKEAKALAERPQSGLQSLDLSGNLIGAKRARALAERLPPGLQALHLNSNEIAAGGARALAEGLRPGLQSLHLRENEIGAKDSRAGGAAAAWPAKPAPE